MPKRIVFTAVLLALVLVSLAAGRVTSQPSEPSSALTAEVESKGTVRVIVHLETPFAPEDELPTDAHIMVQRQEIARVRALVRAGLRGTRHRVVREYDALPFLSLEVGPDALRMLKSLRGVVVHVEKDELASPMLAESVPLIQADQAWALGFDGTGQIVAILDSGVEKNHAFLADVEGESKVVGEACFSSTAGGSTSLCPGGASSSTASDSALPCDSSVFGCDHGTNVAGIAAGSSGVARGAKILAIQMFSRFDDLVTCNGPTPCVKSFMSDQLAALNYVFNVRNSFPGLKVAAVNMSVAGSMPFSSPCDADPLAGVSRKAAIDQLRGAGIATTVPAGNGGFVNSLSAPACFSTAVSVGATLDGTINPPGTPVDTIAAFSNTAPFLSLVAPGQSINSSAPLGGFTDFLGTSQASAHVAAAFAVLKQASPSASVTTILQALQNSGVPITDARANPAIVKPRINVRDAITVLPVLPSIQVVKFSAGLYTVSEATATATITLKRTGAAALVASTAFTVPVTVAPATAVPGVDYVPPLTDPVMVAFAKGQTTASFTIKLLNDTIVDGDRLVNLTLGTPTGPVLKGFPATAVLKLTNNDQGGVMKFALASYSVNEGGTVVVTVMRTGASLASNVSVDYTITGGTAVQGTDFTLANGTLTFLAGQASKTIPIPTVRDFLVGPAKTILLALGNAQGGGAVIVGPGATTTVTIKNIDVGGVMQFSSAIASVFENVPGGTFNLTVKRTGTNLAGSVTVNYAVTGGTAVNNVDYVLANGTVTFGPGQTSKLIAVTINDDALINGNRTVVVTLSNPQGGGTLGTIKVATLTIVDNDALVQFALASDQVLESLTSKVYTVTRSGGSTPVSVHWSASTLESGTLNFTAIQTSATITIPIAAHFSNGTPEGDRTLTLTLDTPAGGAQIGPNNPLNVTVHDDDVAFIAPAEPVASKGQPFAFSFCRPTRDNLSLCGGLAPTTNVSGGQPPYHFVKSAGSLPPNLTLLPNGNVAGTPTGTPGRYKFTLCAVDLAGKQSCKPTSILMVGIDGAYTGTFSGTDPDGPVNGLVAFTVTTTNGVNGTVLVSKPSVATGTVTSSNPPLTFGALVTQGVTCNWTGGFVVNNSTGAVHASGNWNCVIPPNLGGGVASGTWTADKLPPAL